MKKRVALCAVFGLGLVLAGCIVPAVYPFFTEKDLVYDEALVGTWAAADRKSDDKETWTFAKAGEMQYKFSINKEDSTNVYFTHLFKLEDFTFMDCMLVQEGPGIPPHYLAKVAQIKPTLKLATFDLEWLGKLLQANPAAIRHIIAYDNPEDTNTAHVVLTAETMELQRFILKYAGDTNAWANLDEMKRLDAKADH